jgi:hypothetical protein
VIAAGYPPGPDVYEIPVLWVYGGAVVFIVFGWTANSANRALRVMREDRRMAREVAAEAEQITREGSEQ